VIIIAENTIIYRRGDYGVLVGDDLLQIANLHRLAAQLVDQIALALKSISQF